MGRIFLRTLPELFLSGAKSVLTYEYGRVRHFPDRSKVAKRNRGLLLASILLPALLAFLARNSVLSFVSLLLGGDLTEQD